MSRLIVFLVCLASAGVIAGYTRYSTDGSEPTPPIYTVPQRTPEPAPRPAPVTVIEPGDRAALARALQRELKRVGCYGGEITGVWTTSSRMAMKAFIDRVNATLPIDNPDHVLLSLVRGRQERACGVACPEGQTAAEGGACVPDAVVAKAAKEGAADAPSDKGSAALPAAGAAAALAATAATRGSQAETKPTSADDARSPVRQAAGDRAAPHSGPVPPEGVRERRRRRTSQDTTPAPPKMVRDFLRAFGFK